MMRRSSRRPIVFVAIVALLVMPPPVVLSHSGGLDKCGGHHDRKRGGYHVHNWTLYYNCYGWPDELVDPLKELRNWLAKEHAAKRLVEVRAGLVEQLGELDRQLCEAFEAGDGDPGLKALIDSEQLWCDTEGTSQGNG